MSVRPRHNRSRRLSPRSGTSSPTGAALARAWSSAVFALFLGMVLLVVTPGRASAHAELVGSEPSDGQVSERGVDTVRLYFSEPIEPELFALEVYSPDRVRVDRRDARVPATSNAALEATLGELTPGTYTVVWRILSIDGHVVRGAFAFGVGAGASTTSPLSLDLQADVPVAFSATIRWWTFMAGLVLVGGFAFPWLVLPPAIRAAETSGKAAMLATSRFIWVAWGAVVLLLVLGMLGLLVQAAEVTGVPVSEVLDGPAVSRLLSGTKFGTLWTWRMVLTVALLGVVAFATIRSRPTLGVWGFCAEIAATILLTLSFGGHASAVVNAPNLAVGIDWVHMMAAAAWVGGLLQLLLVIPSVLGQPDSRPFLAALVKRFSLVALASVVVLIGTGLYSSLLHVPSWAALQDTAYGAALTGKLLVVLPLLILGGVNLLALHPRIRRAAQQRGRRNQDSAGPFILRRLVIGEIVLIVAVLAATGLLTGLPPATSVPTDAQPFRETQSAGTADVTVEISPNQAGDNIIDVVLRDSSGAPVVTNGPLSLSMTHQDMDMAPREVAAEPAGDGRYRVRGGHLSMTGRWRVSVQGRAADGSELTSRFTPTVGPPPGANRPAFSPARILMLAVSDPSRERGSPVNLVAVAALVVGLVGAWILLRVLRGDRLRRGASFAGAGAVMIGLMLFGTSVADAYWRSLPNPVPATAASIERGQSIYQANCADCHGITGRGDGLAGRFLRPRPADLRVHMAAGHTDQELFDWLSNGVAGTAMPAFNGVLSEEDRWHAVNYIRTFGSPTADGSDARRQIASPVNSPMAGQTSIRNEPIEAAPVSQRSSTSATRLMDAANSEGEPPLLMKMVNTTPDGPWREIGRWQGVGPATIEQFTVTSPWRIRWRLAADDEPFVAMLDPGPNGPVLLTGEDGLTQGVFHIGPAGTFSLAVRTQVPWELVVEDLGTEDQVTSR